MPAKHRGYASGTASGIQQYEGTSQMKLRDLIQHLDKPVTSGSLDVEVKGLTYDSRKAKKGVAFFALRGTKVDGHDFIAKALEDHAAAIFAEIAPPVDCKVPWIHVKNTRAALADVSADFFGNPSDKLIMGGVTGTNG